MLSTPNKAFAALAVSLLAATAAPPAAALAAPQRVEPLILQVIAHQDDDLFFMNPDVDDSISAQVPTITVYLTAGQLTGDGSTDAQRARNRQRGVQNAYANMAGVADGDDSTQLEWVGTNWRIADRTAELYLLRDRPQIMLIFLNLHDGSLRNIDTGGTDDTVVPTAGQATAPIRYNRADVIRVLVAIMNLYRPTLMRTQDPDPDRRAGYTPDHTDHVAAAVLAGEAAAAYSGPLVELNYRNYNIADVPANLSAAQIARKTEILTEYARYDAATRGSISGSGWLSRLYYRWPQGADWVARDDPAHLQAFFVRNGAAYVHGQDSDGAWLGARRLADPGGRLAPGLAVGRHADGRLEVFARRLTDHRIVSLAQQAAGGDFRATWSNLGNPNAGLGNDDLTGTPVVATNADGRMQVFVKNGGGGLSTQRQATAGGAWGQTWSDLGGSDLQDGLSAITTPQGRVEVFAATRGAVQRWLQNRPNETLVRDAAFRSVVPASAPRATIDRQGRIQVAYRRAGTATMMVTTQTQATATAAWTDATDVGGVGQFEPGTVLAPDGRIMMFARTNDSIVAARQTTGDQGFSGWQETFASTVGPPAAMLDEAGRAAVFTVGPSGLAVLEQNAPGSTQQFNTWQDLGM